MLIPLDDPDDPRIAVYRHLKATNETRDLGLFVVEGLKLVERLRLSRFPMASALLSDRFADRVAADLPPEVPAFVLPHKRIGDLVGYNFHQGGLAAGVRVPAEALDVTLARSNPSATLVACPGVRNPENLGAIIRTAEVFGVDALLVEPSCPDYLSRRVLRVSMGTALDLPIVPIADLGTALRGLRDAHDVRSFALVTDPNSDPLPRVERPDRLLVLLGSEAHGLPTDLADACDRRVTIPMRPGAESLNVAVAAGIALHHLAAPDRA